MPRVIEHADDGAASLGDSIAALSASGFDPREEESLIHAAGVLRRLGNNTTFLGDLLVDELAASIREDDGSNTYGSQVVMLHPPGIGDFFIRAAIWPSEGEHSLRASGGASFVYGLPHDHNFDFLTLGYFGPGYWSDYYEFDYEEVAGWSGEPGKIMHYRAHRDVHAQLPADALSVSLNIMHASAAQGWMDQYSFDVDQSGTGSGAVGKILNPGSSEAFLRIAVGLGGGDAAELAGHFGMHHPSDRMRLCAWDALASVAPDAGAAGSARQLKRFRCVPAVPRQGPPSIAATPCSNAAAAPRRA
jgi:hypothetical protein